LCAEAVQHASSLWKSEEKHGKTLAAKMSDIDANNLDSVKEIEGRCRKRSKKLGRKTQKK
jgi:hypothetical protein